MLLKNKWTVLTLFLAMTTAVSAATYCRSGEVTAVKRDNRQPSIQGLNEFSFPESSGSYAYILVTIRPDAGRAMSIYDYCLAISNDTYPCIGLQVGSGAFTASGDTVRDFGGQNVTLCFRVDTKALTGAVRVYLRYQLSATGLVNTEIKW